MSLPLEPLVAAAGLAALAWAGLAAPDLALVNESSSLPRGLYLPAAEAPLRRGAIVALRPPPAAEAYLVPRGRRAGGLILKRVAAGAGDLVCARGDRLITPDRQVRVRAQDRHGAALPRWRDCRRLGDGEVFLLGDSAASFDSRYFGPVRRELVTPVRGPVLTW